MSEELKSTQIVYGENVLMMRVDDCLIFGNKNALRSLAEKLKELPSAEPKRKKGRWIEVHGYVTPGGDPVWKCSECGKGIHVYGIEAPSYNRDYTDGHQWVACPNCGAEMTRGE